MSAFYNSISSVLIILLMTAAGYIFGVKKWMLAEHKPFLEKYLMNFAIPCMCIDGFVRYLSPEIMRASWKIVLISFIGICICVFISALAAYLLRLPRKQAGVFIGMGSFSNAIFVGYPMCRELFGEESILYVMLYFISASILIFAVCYAAFAWFSETERKFDKKLIIKVFINPPVLSAVVAILLVVAGITLPRPLSGLIGYLSGTVSPLALLYCGFIIYETGIKNIRMDRGLAAMPVIRFVLAPLTGVLLCRLFDVTPPVSSIIIVEMAMPVITILVVMAKEWDADVQYAAVGVVLSTLACFVVIPVLMLFI